jgi:N-acetylgalactosamine kinase
MSICVRAPGRVNLIGEHTDYNGYPVLPMAIDREMLLRVMPRADRMISVSNVRMRFAPREWSLDRGPTPFVRGDWAGYIAAAIAGVLDAGLVDRARARGCTITVDGRIPIAAGLSSSSALVVASALGFCAANDVDPDRRVLADVCAHAERNTGIEGGGMDQAVSLLAEAGHALRIDFHPLRTRAVPLPADAAIVVCDSRVEAAKSAGARDAYNLRVAECRAAAALLARAMCDDDGSSPDEHSSLPDGSASSAVPLLADLRPTPDGVPDPVLLEAASRLPAAPLPLDAVAGLLEWSDDDVVRHILTVRGGSVVPIPDEGLRVRDRAMHVLTEAVRVAEAERALRAGNLDALGALMDASHVSCRDQYGVSCSELEAIVAAAKRHGALGARLTGAGFGGCTVNLVRARDLAEFLAGMRRELRTLHVEWSGRLWTDTALDNILFVSGSACGASVEVSCSEDA